MRSLYILQRDLRLLDNKTLKIASVSDRLCLCYLLPKNFKSLSMARKFFIYESVKNLSKQLEKKGQELFLVESIDDINFSLFENVFISKAYNSKDQLIETELKTKSQSVSIIENSNLYKISDLPFSISDLPDVFSNFRRKIEKNEITYEVAEVPLIPKKFEQKPSGLIKCDVYFREHDLKKINQDFNGGETEALDHLKSYLWDKDLARTYKDTRNGMIDFNDSTKLSPWMSLGCISPGTIIEAVKEYEERVEKNESTYWIYFEILWREYFKLYSLKYGDKIFNLHGLEKKTFQLRSDNQDKIKFDEWKFGNLGLAFVDANMKELLQTGWMSNRGRQNVASYLAKDLLIDWRWGAEWFAEHLIDYDIESNWGNWNYVAGVGVDPRDRKFNIQRQASMYDSENQYVDKWLGESE